MGRRAVSSRCVRRSRAHVVGAARITPCNRRPRVAAARVRLGIGITLDRRTAVLDLRARHQLTDRPETVAVARPHIVAAVDRRVLARTGDTRLARAALVGQTVAVVIGPVARLCDQQVGDLARPPGPRRAHLRSVEARAGRVDAATLLARDAVAVLVDGAVTVVVHRVACLLERPRPPDARGRDETVLSAGLRTPGTHPDRGAAGHEGPRRARAPLVDETVTVVVFEVPTRLVPWCSHRARGAENVGAIDRALECPRRLASADACNARGTQLTERLVRLPVAVLVLPVADLDHAGGRAATHRARAVFGAGDSTRDRAVSARRLAGIAQRGPVLVGVAVAVVVGAIADLGRLPATPDADDPTTVLVALPQPRRAVAVALSLAGQAQDVPVLVDREIAVVVQPVADLTRARDLVTRHAVLRRVADPDPLRAAVIVRAITRRADARP